MLPHFGVTTHFQKNDQSSVQTSWCVFSLGKALLEIDIQQKELL